MMLGMDQSGGDVVRAYHRYRLNLANISTICGSRTRRDNKIAEMWKTARETCRPPRNRKSRLRRKSTWRRRRRVSSDTERLRSNPGTCLGDLRSEFPPSMSDHCPELPLHNRCVVQQSFRFNSPSAPRLEPNSDLVENTSSFVD